MMEPALTRRYLRTLLARYATITVPGGTVDRPLSLRAVFQPLKLRSMALAPEEQASGGQRQSSQSEKQVTRCREALEESPSHKIVILGSPGMGKTTALKSLLVDAAQDALDDPDAPLPIFLSLPDLARSGLALPDYLAGIAAAFDLPTDFAAALWQEVSRGKALLCLDSLDEVAPARRPAIIALINVGAREWGGMWIVGSRFTDYKGWQFERGEFSEWELLPMTADLRTQLAERLIPLLYGGMHEEEMAADMPAAFVQTLQGRPQFAAWGENPLLFTLAAVAFVRTGIFPESRAMLYRDVLEAVLMMREAREEQRTVLHQVLANVALQFYQIRGRTFLLSDLLRFLARLRADLAAAWDVESMGERVIGSGLLDVLSYETYGFLHQTFQEYLAALALAERLLSTDGEVAAWELAWSKRTYSRWSEVLRLMVGILAEREEPCAAEMARRWLRSLAGQHATAEGDPGDLGLILAVRSLGEVAGPATRELATGIVLQWAETLNEAARRGRSALWDNPRSKRLLGLVEEIRFFDEQVVAVTVEQLARSLQDDAWQVRQNAAEALGKLPQNVTATILIEALTHEQQEQALWSILRALNEQGQRAPLPVLLAILRTSESSLVMEAAARAITLYGDEAPLEPLLDALRTTASTYNATQFARITLEGLGRRGAAALEALLPELAQEKRPFVVQAFRNPRFAAIAPIQTLLNIWRYDPDTSLRQLTGNVLRDLAVPLPVETLVALLAEMGEESPSQFDVIGCLCNTYASAQEEVIAALNHPVPLVRACVLNALGTIRGAVSTTQAVAMLRDESPLVRKAALDALYWISIDKAYLAGDGIDKEKLLEPFLVACADKDESVREEAVRNLTWLPPHIGARPPAAPFRALAGDRNPEIRALAMRGLAECGDMDALLVGLEDQASVVRLAVVESLERLPSAAPLALLLKALHDESAGVRRAAAEALRTHSTPEALAALIAALEDRSLRGMAIESLGYFGEQAPVVRIAEYLRDRDEWIRWHAIEALHRLRPPAYLGILVLMLESMTDYDDMKKARWMLQDLARDLAAHPEAPGEASASVREAALAVLDWMAERAPAELIFAALHDWHVEVRCQAVRMVRAHCQSDAEAVEKLVPLLQDGFAAVREVTLDELGSMGKHAPVEAIRALLRDEKSCVRVHAVQALGATGNPAILNILINVLNDENEEVRSTAAELLSKPEMDTPDEVLIASLKRVQLYARISILKALGRRPDVPDKILEEALQNESSEYVCKAIKEVLSARREPASKAGSARRVGENEGRQPASPVKRESAVPPEIPPLDTLLEQISRGRVQQLSLLQQVYPDKMAAIEAEAISILTGKGSGMVLGALEQYDVARLIGKMEQPLPGLMGKLAQILESPYSWVQLEAAETLGELRRNVPDRALRRLYHLRLASPNAQVQEAADDALAEILAQEPGIEDDEDEG